MNVVSHVRWFSWMIICSLVCKESMASEVSIGNRAVNLNSLDAWKTGIYITNAHEPSPVSGPLKKWSVFVRRAGAFAFLILRKKPGSSRNYTIMYSDEVVFTDSDKGRAYSQTCIGGCFGVEKNDAIGFYFKSTGGIVPYKAHKCEGVTTYYYFATNNSLYTVGTTHKFNLPGSKWKPCREYALQVTLKTYAMQFLSANRVPYEITDVKTGTIVSQTGSKYAVMQESLVILKASDSSARFHLQFVGSVLFGNGGSQPDPGTCKSGSRDWLAIYEYDGSTNKRYLLPKICGKWESDRKMPVLPDIYSTSNEVHVEFNTDSYKKSPSSGFTIVFKTTSSNATNDPLWLQSTCKRGRTLKMQADEAQYAVEHVHSTQFFPVGNLLREDAPLGEYDCSIDIKGLTGKEKLGLAFTWLQFPSCTDSYIKVYNAKENKYTKPILSVCGTRKPFLLTTAVSQLRIEIRGNVGYGFAFSVYSSSQYMLSMFPQAAEEKEGTNWVWALSAFPIVIIIICWVRSRSAANRAPVPSQNQANNSSASQNAQPSSQNASGNAPKPTPASKNAPKTTPASNNAPKTTPASNNTTKTTPASGDTPKTTPAPIDSNEGNHTSAASTRETPASARTPQQKPPLVPPQHGENSASHPSAPPPPQPYYAGLVMLPTTAAMPSAGDLYYHPVQPMYLPPHQLPPVEAPWSTGLPPMPTFSAGQQALPPINTGPWYDANMPPPPSYEDTVNAQRQENPT